MRFRTLLGNLILLAATAAIAAPPARADFPREKEVEAAKAIGRGDYRAALALYEEAFRGGSEDPAARYNAACAASRAGEPDRAFAYLSDALGMGFFDCGLLARDEDLAAIRSDSRFAPALAVCEAKKREHDRMWDSAVWKTPYTDPLPAADRLAGLSRLWSEAKFGFANFALVPDLDWDREYRDAIPKALAAETTAAYYRVLQELAAKLKDGHSNIALPPELRRAMQAWPAITLRVAEGRVIVREVLDPALAAEGLRAGLEITHVDGIPVHAYGETRVRPAIAASTPQDAEVRTYEYQLLGGAAGTPVRLTFADGDGTPVTRELPRLEPEARAKLRREKPLVEMTEFPGGIAHVVIRSFNDPKVVAEFEKLGPRLAAAKGLVLDVRENGGGDSGNGDRILAMLMTETFPTQRWWTRDYRPAMRAWGLPERRYSANDSHAGSASPLTTAPAVLLVGPRTYSAAEDFTVAFRDAKRGLVLGEPTGGSTGQPLRFALPGGGVGQVCTKRNTFADGTEFVGLGIRPDVTVPTRFDDVRAERDPVLESAVRLLAR